VLSATTYLRPEPDRPRSCRPPGRSLSAAPCRHRRTEPDGTSPTGDVPGAWHRHRTREEVDAAMVSHWFVTILSIVALFVG